MNNLGYTLSVVGKVSMLCIETWLSTKINIILCIIKQIMPTTSNSQVSLVGITIVVCVKSSVTYVNDFYLASTQRSAAQRTVRYFFKNTIIIHIFYFFTAALNVSVFYNCKKL